LWRYFQSPRPSKKLAESSGLTEGTLDDELIIEALSKTPGEWAAIAEAHARSAEYRRAIRALFLRMICLLDSTRVLEFQPSETNRGLAITLQARSTLAAGSFEAMVQTYEAVWYGELEGAAATYDGMRTLGNGVEAAVQSLPTQSFDIAGGSEYD
jgi:hypothetical protein